MHAYYQRSSLVLLFFILGCGPKIDEQMRLEYPNAAMMTVKNETDLVRVDEPVVFDLKLIQAQVPDFNPNAFVVFCEATELASQANDLNGDGEVDEIVVLTNFNPNEQKKLNFLYAPAGNKTREYPKRTQAEISIKVGGEFVNRKYEGGAFQNIQFLRVPPEHTDHSNFIRYEGPGWESDIVGYRFYLDWRNAIDIFGKKSGKWCSRTSDRIILIRTMICLAGEWIFSRSPNRSALERLLYGTIVVPIASVKPIV